MADIGRFIGFPCQRRSRLGVWAKKGWGKRIGEQGEGILMSRGGGGDRG